MQTTARNGDDFSRLVYDILVTEKKRRIRDVAVAIGMEYANFYSRLIGRTHFKANEIARLISEVPDARLCDYLLRNTAFVAVPRPMGGGSPNKDVFDSAARLAAESLAAMGHIGDTLLQGEVDSADYEHLSDHLREAERALGNLRASLASLVPRKARVALPGGAMTPTQEVLAAAE